MKNLWLMIALTFLLAFAGIVYSHQLEKGKKMSDFKKEWQQVEAYQNKRLPKSALEVVEKIYKRAKQENNSGQVMKALVYKMQFLESFEEEGLKKNITRIETEIGESGFPVTPVLQSMLAGMYWQYYTNNRYRILDRSEADGAAEDDIATWSAGQFAQKAIDLHLASLSEAEKLKKVLPGIFDPVLETPDGSRKFRPTLYDLLAHRAIDFFMNDEADLTNPLYEFRLDEKAFLPAAEFVKTTFETRDSLSFKYHTLQLFQDLIRFHLDDAHPDALVDVDLKRLAFAKNHAIAPDKDALYLKALEDLEKACITHEVSTWVTYQIANHFYQQGSAYNPLKGEAHQWDWKKAFEICDTGLKRFPNSDGAKNCRALQSQIQSPYLKVEFEKITLPDQPFRALVEHQNVGTAYFRIIKLTPEQMLEVQAKRRMNNQQWIDFLKKQPMVKEWQVDLPNEGDYQRHGVEVKIPALPQGYYGVLVGTSKSFSLDGNAVARGNLWISRLGFVERSESYRTKGFYIFDRESGKPLENATVQSWFQKRGSKMPEKGFVLTTDKNGYCELTEANVKDKASHRFRIDVQYKGDRLFLLGDQFSVSFNRRAPQVDRPVKRTFLFTDRAIYRPGQTVHYKGLMLESQGGKAELLTGQKNTVQFFDANGQKVAETEHTSNDFGTFSGTFTAPTGGLTGQMSIRANYGSVNFSVEEYKRPTFEVSFQPVTGSFKLGETVKVTGQAKAYSGANIDGGQVQYRVVRTPRFPYWWGFWRWGGNYEDTEIANGITKTDENGEVVIEFTAAADPTISAEQQPVFDYSVSIDVTDIGGETRSANTIVKVGYVALSVGVNLPETMDKAKLPKVEISTTNLNGEFEAASGTVEIYQLQDPGRIFREREWQQPDQFLISKADYYAAFPHDVYQDENDYRNWERGEKMLDVAFDTEKSKDLNLDAAQKWAQGKYVAELKTEDKFSKKITLTRFFTLSDAKEKSVPDHALFWHTALKDRAEPGEEAAFAWGSAAGDVHALLEVYRRGEKPEIRWMKTNDKKQSLTFPVTEADRGNFSFSLFFVKYGRTHHATKQIYVPWSNKDLKITYETFRDKLKPGQEETWKLKISGPDGEKVAAEMLAGMYDASLDAFRAHAWNFSVYPSYPARYRSSYRSRAAFGSLSMNAGGKDWRQRTNFVYRQYEQWQLYAGGYGMVYGNGRIMSMSRGGRMESRAMAKAPAPEAAFAEDMEMEDADAITIQADESDQGAVENPAPGTKTDADFGDVQVRSNLNETAFFFPHLETNAEGEIILSFTIPEALTRWKLLGFAHTKDLEFGLTENEVVTQKELMVVPNAPRFFREGDAIVFSGKVVNLSEADVSGSATLQLFDALTMNPVDDQLGNKNSVIPFSAKAGQSAPLRWKLKIPAGVQAVTYRVIAKTDNFSDGEENALPVLTNRMLVTESLPLPIRGNQTKTFRFDKLLEAEKSSTLVNHNFTLEFTSNPAGYAIQALPYMMEYPYECAEQVFSRYYANSIASYIANSNPKIKRVFDTWRNRDTDALLSNLEKNQELKALLLEETPWVRQAQDENERKKRVALLFDLNKMSHELESALRKLQQMQDSDGGWPWFPGMRTSRYITTHIVSGLGHLDRLGVTEIRGDARVQEMLQRAIAFLDREMKRDYDRLLERKAKLDEQQIGNGQIQYLYARSYFLDMPVEDAHQTAYNYWQSQAKKYWTKFNKYMQGMIALSLHRMNERDVPQDIVKSLREHALQSEEFGMYWKENSGGYYWYQAPIETQALLIEVFDEVANDQAAVNEMKIWLLKQKQTQDWKTTKATAEACYALLMRGTDLLASDKLVEITLGDQKIDPMAMDDVKVEAGTGYFKTNWQKSEIKPEMGNITVTKSDDGVAWGAAYWQYFEQLDKITSHETPLKLVKQLFRQDNTDSGPKLTLVDERTALKPGDLVKVRIELRVDRHLEYVHLKDMRAAGFEPVNVLSTCKYQGGLVYYESTRDAATNFFIGYLPKGTHVFEYSLRVSHEGNFSNGITTIQCMYAPEFTSHSEGIRVEVGG